ncbi:HAD family hydrolase [Melioribacter sp. Ez-97]|uniref:HAD family hydrolase n=1 Tax=Melioribacter sp. Ez-97 TaxID=3423434 RepID=UPI003ED9EE18
MKKIIVFDFDKTVTINDTNLMFYKYMGKNDKIFYFKLIIYLFFKICRKTGFISNKKLKNIGLFLFLKGINKNTLEKKSAEFSKTISLNKNILEIINNYIKANYFVLIISASFEIYIKYVFPNLRVIGSTLDYSKKYPKIDRHCYSYEKKNQLKKLGLQNIDALYTDSGDDLPLAEMAKEIFLVKKNRIIKCSSLKEFKILSNKRLWGKYLY